MWDVAIARSSRGEPGGVLATVRLIKRPHGAGASQVVPSELQWSQEWSRRTKGCIGGQHPAAGKGSAPRPREHIDEFLNGAILGARILALHCLAHAVADVIAQDFLLDAAKRRPRRRKLGYDVDAVTALFDHAR